MRMTSNFRPLVGGEGGELQDRRVLMGGDIGIGQELTFGFENLYETRSASGEKYRPIPGIESIEVEEKLESFECTVNWFANSIGQLERLFPYFMNSGVTVIVEWGWDNVPPSAPIDVSNQEEVRSYYQQLGEFADADEQDEVSAADGNQPKILSLYQSPKYRKLREANGLYSFVAGTVTDFSYSPQGNSQYSCTTELTSISKAMSRLQNRDQEKRRVEGEGGEGSGTGSEESSKEKLDLYKYFATTFLSDIKEETNSEAGSGGFGGSKDVVSVSAETRRREKGTAGSTVSGTTYYVSWGKIEEIVNIYSTMESSPPGGGTGVRNLEFDSASSIVSSAYFKKVQNPDGSTEPLQLRSTSPLVCLVDVGGQTEGLRNFSETSQGFSEGVKTPADQLDDDAIEDPSRQGLLYNLYIEYQVVLDAFQKQETVFKAMKWILDKANAACFDIWNWEFIIDTNTARIIDKNMTSGQTVEDRLGSSGPFEFQPNTRLSVLRDFNFDTNLSDLMKSQIIAQRNADRSGSSKNAAVNSRNDANARFFKGAFPGEDIVLSSLEKRDEAKRELETKESNEDPQNAITGVPLPTPRAESLTGYGITDLFGFNTVDQNNLRQNILNQGLPDLGGSSPKNVIYEANTESGISLGRAFSKLLQSDETALSGINGNATLNINAQLTLDGIGGFCAFQVIKIKNIPRVFENKGVFTVDSVTHSVSKDDWTTELKTKFVVQNNLDLDREDGVENTEIEAIPREELARITDQEQEQEDSGEQQPAGTSIPDLDAL
jgi:hypothetical protein